MSFIKRLGLSKLQSPIFRDSIVVAFADYMAYGAIFVLTILINRYLGTAELGHFSFAFALSALLIYSINGAFSAIIKRDVAVSPDQAGRYIGSFLSLRVGVTALIGLLLYLMVILPPNTSPALITAVLLVFAIKAIEGLSEVFYAVFQATSRMLLYAALKSAQQLVFLGVSVFALVSGASAANVYGLGVAVAAVFFVFTALLVLWGQKTTWQVDGLLVRYAAVQSWPLLVNAAVFALTARMGILVVNGLEGSTAGGVYAAALNIVNGVGLLPGAVGVVLFPILSRMYANQPTALKPYMQRLTLQLGVVGAAFAAMVFVLSPWIVRLYGDLPAEATSILMTLSLGLVFMFAQPPSGYMFTAIHRQREGMLYAVIMLAVCAPLYLALTLAWGTHGTAWAFVIHQGLWVAGAYVWVRRLL